MTQATTISEELNLYKPELSNELSGILGYWMKYTIDEVNGGFYGCLNEENEVLENAPKGSVLNARILWSFSAAYNLTKKSTYLDHATRAYEYITEYFVDKDKGGVFWTVDHLGNPLDTKKQVYAIAFTIYGLSEYYLASGNSNAKYMALNLYNTLIRYSYDEARTGYLEAFTRDWQPISDLRLSAKDANEKKTMNTHLHVLEAYTNLYRIWPDDGLKKQITILLDNFVDHFINPETHHLNLFFDEHWNSRSGLVSYGHDIEATWLLQEAAEVINDEVRRDAIKKINLAIAEATLQGLDTDGGLWYEYDPGNEHLIKEKHWWVQAEAMVGFYNTWQISGDDKYIALSKKSWDFVKANILDTENGEWHWGVTENGEIMPNQDKVGLWKCPYHNTRACIELIKRIKQQP